MNTEYTYTDEEKALIIQHESRRIEEATAAFEAADAKLRHTATGAERWETDDFRRKVAAARRALGDWSIVMIVLISSFILNCVLVQEITPDMAAMVGRLFPFAENFIATLILTGLVFGLMLLIKDKCDTSADFSQLRPGLHPAVAAPVRKRIRRKIAVKALYLLALFVGYLSLYRYIAGGVMLEQRSLDTAQELARSTTISLGGGSGPDSLDEEIASSQAASFAVYYSIEWCLHAAILFLGGSHWFTHGFDIALASKRRDRERHDEARRNHIAASSRLRTLCRLRTPDDGANGVRSQALAATALDCGPSTDPSGETDFKRRNIQPKANGSRHSLDHELA